MRSPAERRRATFERGRFGEFAALLALVLKGYRPLARRFSAAGGEIDLVVMRGETIAFVEVKARGRMADAAGAITATKRRRFARAVRAWLSRHPWSATKTWRADAVLVAPRRWPVHVVDAFTLEIE